MLRLILLVMTDNSSVCIHQQEVHLIPPAREVYAGTLLLLLLFLLGVCIFSQHLTINGGDFLQRVTGVAIIFKSCFSLFLSTLGHVFQIFFELLRYHFKVSVHSKSKGPHLLPLESLK